MARDAGPAPQLIYLPEVPFDTARFIEDVRCELSKSPAVLIAVSEGVRFADGTFVGESSQNGMVDVFGHKYLSGAGQVLENIVRSEIGCKVRSIDLSLMQRCAGHLASSNDLSEAKMLGATAFDRALKGVTGEVSVITRLSDTPYRVTYGSVPASEIANRIKYIPREWINERGNDVTEEMLRYLTPLVGGGFDNEAHNGLPFHYKFPEK
jgi:6-phosphofructokinase 1